MNCINCDPNPSGAKQCNILLKTLIHGVDEPEYPKEWTYDENDRPICTSYVKWDWDSNGDPDDPDNPNAPIPDDPNQLMLFSEADEILNRERTKELITQPSHKNYATKNNRIKAGAGCAC